MPDPKTGKRKGLRHREDHGRFWWELRPCAYYGAFAAQKVVFTEITWTPSFAIDRDDHLINNTGYMLTSSDVKLIAVLNSPISWWYGWRDAVHGKDEALRFMASYIERFPLAQIESNDSQQATDRVMSLIDATASVRAADHALADWLTHEIGLAKLPAALAQSSRLDSDGFVATVRAALPKRAGITPTRLMQLRAAFAETAEPARAARVAALADERALSDIVNRAYGLTPDDIALMWRTAPPRMPLASPMPTEPSSTDSAADLI